MLAGNRYPVIVMGREGTRKENKMEAEQVVEVARRHRAAVERMEAERRVSNARVAALARRHREAAFRKGWRAE